MKRVNLGIISLGIGLATACSGTHEDLGATALDTTIADDSADFAQPAQTQELHAFEYAGTRYTILEVDGELLTAFSHPRHAPIPHVVAADGGDLTLLEKYLAFQPDGVHARDHHAQRADGGRRLRRSAPLTCGTVCGPRHVEGRDVRYLLPERLERAGCAQGARDRR